MLILESGSTYEEIIKKSRFIATAIPCSTEQEALKALQHLHSKHSDANHIAFAYRIKTEKTINQRFFDAGEPSGTAGKPIYNHLEGKDLINILCVVIRYFGGVKLGAGGLTRAYGNTAKKALDNASFQTYIAMAQKKFVIEYNQMQEFQYQLTKLDGKILDQSFTENIELMVTLPEINADQLTLLFK